MKESDKTQIEQFYKERYGKPCGDKPNPRIKKVIEIFSKHKFDRILDIGCGDTSLSFILKDVSSANEIYGVDITEEMFKHAKRGIKLFQLDIAKENLPFADNFFDAVFCGELIEHLFDTDHLLDEIHRVLKREGFCVITTPNLACWYNRIALFLGYQPYYTEVSSKYKIGHFIHSVEGVAGHIRNFTYRSFLQLIKKHPFDVVEIHGAPANLPFPFNIFDAFLSRFSSFSSSCIVVARAI